MAVEQRWRPDGILGEGFESTVLEASAIAVAGGRPCAGPRIATLIRYLPPSDGVSSTGSSSTVGGTGTSLLFLHGWSDYFFNTDLARFFSGLGIAFYALDMHNHGRSLRSGDLGGFVSDLRDYDPELRLALSAVAADTKSHGATGESGGTTGETDDAPAEKQGSTGTSAGPRIALMGHSTAAWSRPSGPAVFRGP
ncbi:hypothetical protein [Arthrobacter sp. A5]|uniref:hypothetical protein n=1 Tax=Arthrobacter sp. A5 TaxID=576926 RepID=UPI003DA8554B